MQHVDEGLLTAYADGQLDASSARHIVAHVQGCAECQAQLAGIQRTSERAKSILAEAGIGQAMPTFDAVVARSRQGRGSLRSHRMVRPLAWAASLVIVSGIMWYQFKGGPAGASEDKDRAAGPSITSRVQSARGGRVDDSAAAKPAPVQLAARAPRQDSAALKAEAKAASHADESRVALDVGGGIGGTTGAGAGQVNQAAPPPSAPRMQRAARQRDEADSAPVYEIEGLPIVSRTRLGDTVRTVQQIDSTLTVELTQEVIATPTARRRGQPAAEVLTVTVPDSGVAVIEKGRYRITAKAAVSADSLRALLLKLK